MADDVYFPSRHMHLRAAYRALEDAKQIGKKIDNPPAHYGDGYFTEKRAKQALCYAEATAHFAAATIPDLQALQQQLVVR